MYPEHLDAAVILLPEGERLPIGMASQQVREERLVVVAPRRQDWRRAQSIADLARAQWILNPEGCAARAALRRVLLRANLGIVVAVEAYNYAPTACLGR